MHDHDSRQDKAPEAPQEPKDFTTINQRRYAIYLNAWWVFWPSLAAVLIAHAPWA